MVISCTPVFAAQTDAYSVLKSSGTSPNFLITLASPVAGSPARLKSLIQAAFSAGVSCRDIRESRHAIAADGTESASPPLGAAPLYIPVS
jgi:hypothetical protein